MARGKVWTGLLVVVLLVGALVPAGRTTAPAAAGSVDDLSTLTGYWRDLYPDQFSSESATFTEQFEPELLAKAEPDECFNGPGVPYTGTVPVCPDGIPKVNQAYVWGMAKPGDEVWFGTGPNIHCLVLGSYLGIGLASMVPILYPEVVVLAGGVSEAGGPLLEAVEKSFRRTCGSCYHEGVVVRVSTLGWKAVAIGAAAPLFSFC